MNWRQTVASLLICHFVSPSPNLDQTKINPAARISSVTRVYHYFISVVWNQKPVNSNFSPFGPTAIIDTLNYSSLMLTH